MTSRPAPGVLWIGDQVYDAATDRQAVITDVEKDDVYVLRPVYGAGSRWTATDPARLTLTMPRAQRVAEGRI